jgi:hypothetical protein
MSLAPPQKLVSCLKALYHATVRLRDLGYSGEQTGLSPAAASEVAAIADAVHNLPYLVQNWETCDEQLLRSMLGDCDARYPSRWSLLEAYDRASSGTG